MKKKLIAVCIPLIILSFISLVYAWTGKVVGISDGDTIKVLQDGKQVKIRLYGVDTPEKKQAFGKAAKKFTGSLVAGKVVRGRRSHKRPLQANCGSCECRW